MRELRVEWRVALETRLEPPPGSSYPAGTRLAVAAADASLTEPITDPTRVVHLETGAELGPGSGLAIGDNEGVIVDAAAVDLDRFAPRHVGLEPTTGPRFPHAAGTPVRLVGRPVASSALAIAIPDGARELTLEEPGALPVAAGDVLQVDDGERVEYARVASVDGARIVLSAPLLLGHPARRPLVLLERAPTTTPSREAFPHAETSGPELVLQAAVRAGETWLELDSVSGLQPGDVLALEQDRTDRTEQVRIRALPREEEAAPGAGVLRRAVILEEALGHDHAAGASATALVSRAPVGSGTGFLEWLAGWIGLELRPDRGERWNRELARVAGRIWPWRGTRRGVDAFLALYLRGEARDVHVVDAPNPIQVGVASTVGADAVISGMPPHFFELDVETDPRNGRLHAPEGLRQMIQAIRAALRNERPAHTYYDVRLQAQTMQIGVDSGTEIGARVGDTTLLWTGPLVVEGER